MSEAAIPRSLMAHFMMATILRDSEYRDQIQAQLVSTRWRDADGLVNGALAVALDTHFAAPPTLPDVRKLSRKVVRWFPDPRMSVGEVELVVRSALGESVNLSAIPEGRTVGLKMLIFAGIVRMRDCSIDEIGNLLIGAERWALVRGFRPTFTTDL